MVVEKVHGGEGFEDVRNYQMRPRSTTMVKKLGFKSCRREPCTCQEERASMHGEDFAYGCIRGFGEALHCQETSKARG